MKILGVELDFDFCDADQAEDYEREVRRVVDKVQDKKQYEGKSNADGIRIQCGIIDDFFDAVFGAGTADRLFHGKANLREHMEAFGAVSEAARESNTELLALAAKYAPNRAARRQEQRELAKMKERDSRQRTGQHHVLARAEGAGGSAAAGQVPTLEQIDFIKRFAQMLPEMEDFMRSYPIRQGAGEDG